MKYSLITSALLACCTQRQLSVESAVVAPKPRPDPSRGTLVGRVLLDGNPIEHFGVILSKNFARTRQPRPIAFTQSNGRFTIEHISPGQWDVIIVGPGFARRVILNQEILASRSLDLGDVSVRAGFVVSGTVVDHSGSPVTDASVRVTQLDLGDSGHSGELLTDLSRGNHETRTNSKGDFLINGVTVVDLSNPRILVWALSSSGRSFPESFPSGNQNGLRLILKPTGTIEGAVNVGNNDVLVMASPVSNSRRVVSSMLSSHMYRLELPEGDYDLYLFAMTGTVAASRKRVRVVSGTAMTVDFLIQ